MNILCYRSSYFRRALASNKKKDNVLAHIKFPNISPEIFQIILRYIYGDSDREPTENISLPRNAILSIVKDTNNALNYHTEHGPCFGKELLIYTSEDSADIDFDKTICHEQKFYEKSIRKKGEFPLEDYETFLLINDCVTTRYDFYTYFKSTTIYAGHSEKEIVCLIDDDDLASVIWTQGFKALPIVVDACIRANLAIKHKTCIHITSANEATRHEFISSVFIAFLVMMVKWVCQEYKSSGSHGKGPVDWVIKIGDTIVVIEAKREDINQRVDWVIINKEINDLIPKEPANVPDSVIAQLKQCKPDCKINNTSSKLLEDRDLDAFLDEVQKKKVITDEMRQMKQSKKLREDDSQKNLDSGCS
ncbi:BTB/POZ protein [Rhizophagus irregularis DAOM 181602=DAOM 197198]|nr:BTB/POZ protein [Rhizophagus irregularis DAOM 181602=DAOM 197198]